MVTMSVVEVVAWTEVRKGRKEMTRERKMRRRKEEEDVEREGTVSMLSSPARPLEEDRSVSKVLLREGEPGDSEQSRQDI